MPSVNLRRCGVLLSLAIFVEASVVCADEGNSPAPAMANRVDELLAKGKTALPAKASDEVFLRRITLDLTGQIPTPDELRAFLADTNPDKRTKLIDRLLSGQAYAVNWPDIGGTLSP